MVKSAAIVSFDEVKRGSATAGPAFPRSRALAGAHARRAVGAAQPAHAVRGAHAKREPADRAAKGFAGGGSSARHAAPSSTKNSERSSDGEVGPAQQRKVSRREKLRCAWRKRLAGWKFARQFGAGGAGSGSAEVGGSSGAGRAAPRAAVYKGQMGASHKRAARMQGGGPTGILSAAARLFSLFSPKRPSRRFAVGAVAAACVVLTCSMLYPATQQYYQSVREHDRLLAEYEAIQTRNEALQSEVDALSTDAGIEDAARRDFGWVKDGERSANVSGLSKAGDEDDSFRATVLPGSVEPPDTWYSGVLDPLFGVK